MRALEIITGHVIYNPAYTYKFQLKTTLLVSISGSLWLSRVWSESKVEMVSTAGAKVVLKLWSGGQGNLLRGIVNWSGVAWFVD